MIQQLFQRIFQLSLPGFGTAAVAVVVVVVIVLVVAVALALSCQAANGIAKHGGSANQLTLVMSFQDAVAVGLIVELPPPLTGLFSSEGTLPPEGGLT